MIFRKADLQSINPTRLSAQSGPISIHAVYRKRQILSTAPKYLPPVTTTNPARKRHCHSGATVPPCDRQTSKQVWKKWRPTPVNMLNFSSIRKFERRAPINVISYIVLFLKAIKTLLDTCSQCRLRDPEFAKKHKTSSTIRSIGFQNLNTCEHPYSKYEFSRTPLWSKSLI
jgi:hypothetical protein